MANYIRENFIKELTDSKTGECKTYKEVKSFKRTSAKGWRMTYQSYLEEVLGETQGKKKISLLFFFFNQFKKNKKEVQFDQTKIAKKFETNRTYISKFIKQLLDLKVLLVVRSNIGSVKWYRLNPYLTAPSGSNALELQDEWDILVNAPSKIKDKFEYLHYLQSDEWENLSSECKRLSDDKCDKCGSEKDLECHHLTYDNLYSETQDDLQCLCRKCHNKEHKTFYRM